jgi:hypothetical protein
MVIRGDTSYARLSEEMPPLTVTVAAAKKLSGLGSTTLWNKIRDETLSVVRVGRRTLIVYRSLERMLSASASASRPSARREGPVSTNLREERTQRSS